jgi:hypothetical protein
MDGFAVKIASSAGNYPGESSQNMTFETTLVSGDPILEPGTTPQIDSATGALSFCLQLDAVGSSTYSVMLKDDGGGSLDSAGPILLGITVLGVNQAPKFQFTNGSHLVLWENQGEVNVTGFLTNISKGNVHPSGEDWEAYQNATFTVSAANRALFEVQPSVDLSGKLSLKLKKGVVGNTSVTVTFKDDGGMDRGGVNKLTRVFWLTVARSYAVITLNVSGRADVMPNTTERMQRFRSLMGAALSVDMELVLPEENAGADSCYQFSVPTQTTRDSLNLIRPNTIAGLISALIRQLPGIRITTCENATAYLRNYPNVPRFNMTRSVQVLEFAHPASNPVTKADFMLDILAPQHTPLDSQGNEKLTFLIEPVRHRPYEGSDWVNGGDGGLLSITPFFSVLCKPLCVKANLTFAAMDFMNGEVEYSVTLQGSVPPVSHNLTVRIMAVNLKPSFLVPAQLTVREANDTNMLITAHGFAQNVSAGNQTSDQRFQNVTRIAVTLVDHTSAALFEEVPEFDVSQTAEDMWDLFFTLVPGANGVVNLTAVAYDDGRESGRNYSDTMNFSIVILSVNDAPYIELANCTDSGIEVNGGTCRNVEDGSADMSGRVIEVLEHCFGCEATTFANCTNGSYVFPDFVQRISASFAQYSDEEASQAVSVSVLVTEMYGDLFQPGGEPVLNITDGLNGSLTFCLKQDRYGWANISIIVTDNGPLVNSGINTFGPINVSIVVHPVNQQPFFDLCCGDHLLVWMGSGNITRQGYITHVRAGKLDSDQVDAETLAVPGVTTSGQTYSFNVTVEDTTLFDDQPTMFQSSDLQMTVSVYNSGKTNATIRMTDNGTTYAGMPASPANIDEFERDITITVANSYVKIVLNVSDSSASAAELHAELRRIVASKFGMDVALVIFPDSMPTTSRRLLMNLVTLYIATTSIDEAMSIRDVAESTIGSVNVSGTMTYFVSADAFLVNRGVTPTFDINDASILLLNNDYVQGNPFVLPDFLVNISAPPDSPIDVDGMEQVVFTVRAVEYRPFLYGNWTAIDGSEPGLLTELPKIRPLCSPKCTNATLTLTQMPNVNGQVRYEVVLGGTQVIKNFTVAVKFAFTLPGVVDVQEEQPSPEFPNFVNIAFLGMAGSQYPMPIDWVFTLVPTTPGALFAMPPSFNSVGDLSFVLLRDAVGILYYSVDVTDGQSTSRAQTVVFNVSAVNDAPLFNITNVVVREDQYTGTVFSSSTVVTNVSTGPPDEGWQNVTFTAVFVTGDDLLQASPAISLQNSSGAWVAQLHFQTKPYRNGWATYQVYAAFQVVYATMFAWL